MKFIFKTLIIMNMLLNVAAIEAQNLLQPIKPTVIGFSHYKNLSIKPLPDRLYRILVGKNYPPFNYKDKKGQITGFNIDIARALCLELNIACQIIAKQWQSIKADLKQDAADFAVASMAISTQNLNNFLMTTKYYDTPARFIIRKNAVFDIDPKITLTNKNVAIVRNTGHEAYIVEYFSNANIYAYPNINKALQALKDAKVMAVFADAITTRYWLKSKVSEACCIYAKGDFYDQRFLGQGAAIALPKNNIVLKNQLDIGLARIWASGRYEEIFAKYFAN